MAQWLRLYTLRGPGSIPDQGTRPHMLQLKDPVCAMKTQHSHINKFKKKFFFKNVVLTLEKEMATHSRILTWKIPWTEEPGGLQSMGS